MFLYDVQSVFCICLRADKGSLTFLTSLDVFNIQYRVTVCKNLCRNVTAVHDRSIYWKEIWVKSNYFFSCVYYLYFRGFRSVSKLFISFRFTVFVSTYKEVSSTRQYKYIHPSRLIPTLCMAPSVSVLTGIWLYFDSNIILQSKVAQWWQHSPSTNVARVKNRVDAIWRLSLLLVLS